MSAAPDGGAGLPDRDAAVDVVVFRVAGHLFGIEAEQVRGSRPAAGDAAQTIEALLGFPAAPVGAALQLLTIKGGDGDWELGVAPPLELRRLPAAAIHPVPDLVAARTGLPGLRALALGADGLMVLVNAGDRAPR